MTSTLPNTPIRVLKFTEVNRLVNELGWSYRTISGRPCLCAPNGRLLLFSIRRGRLLLYPLTDVEKN